MHRKSIRTALILSNNPSSEEFIILISVFLHNPAYKD